MNYTLENFISYCDDMMIAEEGFFNNKNKETKSSISTTITPQLLKASSSDFDRLYKKEAMCAEGMRNHNSKDTMYAFAKVISEWEGHPDKLYLYYCDGRDLNRYYHLTGDNQYPDNLGIFFIDWSNFGKDFKASQHKGNFRWFSDVVDNNARVEIRKGNPHYKNYHSYFANSKELLRN